MAKNSPKKKKKMNYSPNKLAKALDDINNGTTFVQASKKYNIPRTTLISKVIGVRPKEYVRPGLKPLLGEEIEKQICDWLLDCAKNGFPVSVSGLQFTIKKILEENPDINLDKTSTLRKWTSGFFNRHPELRLRISEHLHGGRACASEEKIRKWFQEVKDTLGDQMEIFEDSRRVFNSDETAIYLNPKGGPVIAEKGQKYVYNVGQCNKENVTVLITANANGEIAPPLALYSFERIPTAIKKFAPGHWGIGRSPNGWMTAECFFEYMTNVFAKYLEDSKIPKPIIFIVDGHKSHLSLQVNEFCRKEGIILIALPSNCTHILQPLDVSFFAPLKSQWKKYLGTYKMQHKVNVVEKHDVAVLLNDILESADFKDTLKNGFRTCGLSPYNVEEVDFKKIVQKEPKPAEKPIEEPCSIPNNQSAESVKFLKQFESRLSKSTLDTFWNCYLNHKLPETESLHGLFQYWVECLVEVTPPDEISTSYENDIQCGTFEILQGGEVAPCPFVTDETLLGVDPLSNVPFEEEILEFQSDDFSKIPVTDVVEKFSSENNNMLLDVNNGSGSVPQNSLAMDADRILEELDFCYPENGTVTVTPDKPTQSNSQENEVSNAYFSPTNCDENPRFSENCAKSADRNSTPTDCDEIYNHFSLNRAKSMDHISTIQPQPNADIVIRHAKSAESVLENRKMRVTKILGSFTMFKTKHKPSEQPKTCRKKLELPSVATCDQWVELQNARIDEQIALEEVKENRKKISQQKKQDKEKKREAFLEKKRLKLEQKKKIENFKNSKKSKLVPSTRMCKSKKIKPTCEGILRESTGIHNGQLEVKLKDWVLVKFKMGKIFKKFIGQVECVKNGKLKGNFLRPAHTKEHNGYMYKFPNIPDLTFFQFFQIEKIVHLESCKRGLYYFPSERFSI